MLKKAVQQGHSERGPQAYPSSPAHPELPRQLVSPVGYIEDLNDARMPLADFFSILLDR
jgi:hypothetical protein